MKVFICLLVAVVSAASAASFHGRTGVTTRDIDILIKDAMLEYRKMWEKMEPMEAKELPKIPIENTEAFFQMTDTKIWIGHTSSYSESSSMNDKELAVSVDVKQSGVQLKGKLALTGKLGEKAVDQTGTFELTWNDVGTKASAKFALDKKSVKLIDLESDNTYSVPEIKLSGLEVEGFTAEELGKSLGQSIINALKKQEEEGHEYLPKTIESINKEMAGYNLQQCYDWLREKIPKHVQKFPFMY